MTDTIKITILEQEAVTAEPFTGDLITLDVIILVEDEAKTWQLPPLNDGSSFQL